MGRTARRVLSAGATPEGTVGRVPSAGATPAGTAGRVRSAAYIEAPLASPEEGSPHHKQQVREDGTDQRALHDVDLPLRAFVVVGGPSDDPHVIGRKLQE